MLLAIVGVALMSVVVAIVVSVPTPAVVEYSGITVVPPGTGREPGFAIDGDICSLLTPLETE